MEKRTIIAIVGLSGSGKTTIANLTAEKLNTKRVVTLTTRPIRPNEINGEDYRFISKELYNLFLNTRQIKFHEQFDVANGKTWMYGTRDNHIRYNKPNLIILTPSGVYKAIEEGFNVISLYIHVDDNVRFQRIYGRKDNQGNDEINRRNKEDLLKFSGFKPDYIIDNSGDDVLYAVDRCVDIIKDILKKED